MHFETAGSEDSASQPLHFETAGSEDSAILAQLLRFGTAHAERGSRDRRLARVLL